MTAPVNVVRLVVDGTVVGKGRPKFSRHGDRINVRTPQRTKAAEARVVEAWQDAGALRLPEGPVALDMSVALARPQAHWRKDGSLSAAGERAIWPLKRPDLDNVLKLVADSLNGHAYRDDAQIVAAHVARRWAHPGEDEHIAIALRAVPGYDLREVLA